MRRPHIISPVAVCACPGQGPTGPKFDVSGGLQGRAELLPPRAGFSWCQQPLDDLYVFACAR